MSVYVGADMEKNNNFSIISIISWGFGWITIGWAMMQSSHAVVLLPGRRRALRHPAPRGQTLRGHRQGSRHAEDHRARAHGADPDRGPVSHELLLHPGRAADGHAVGVGHAQATPVLHRPQGLWYNSLGCTIL